MKHNGATTVSLLAGLLVEDILSTGGCSVEKMPHIVGAVLNLIFGVLPEEVTDVLVKSSGTYNTARERSMEFCTAHNSALFTCMDHSESIVQACLCMDLSNKMNRNLVAKPYVARCMDGVVRTKGLLTDVSISKKADVGKALTLASLTEEIGALGILKLCAATADRYGVAEVQKIMEAIDEQRIFRHTEHPEEFTVNSSVVQGLTFDIGCGHFGAERVRSCSMHAFECILKPLLVELVQTTALENDAHIGHNMYSLSYYMDKFRAVIQTLNLLSVDGDIDNISDCPTEVMNIFKKICLSRWLSAGRQSRALIRLLSVPASAKLVTFVAAFYGGEDSAEWAKIAAVCTCIDDDSKVSHCIISFLYMSNHSPGGAKGDGHRNCSNLVAFLNSPLQRVSIYISSLIYERHLEWARFADGKNPLSDTRVISTRMVELPVFERHALDWLSLLSFNWRQALPGADAFLQKEAQRAVRLGMFDNESTVINHVESLMKKGT